jgi:hypothetical protein
MNLRLFAMSASTIFALSASARASDSPWVQDDEPEKPAPPTLPPTGATPTPVDAAMKKKDPAIDVQLDVGFACHRIFDVPIYGADFSVGFGHKSEESAWRITFGGFVGETDVGFQLDEFHFGLTEEARPAPWFRFGADFHFLYIAESPPTGAMSTGPTGWSLGPGARPYIAFDFAPGGTASPSLTFGFEVTVLGGSESEYVLWGPSVDLGVHF